jgi:hypothetical protein
VPRVLAASRLTYMCEVERLTELRDQLRGAAMIRPTVRVKGVDDLWALLAEMFDSLIISDGEIVNFVPRADRVGEVVGLVEQAIPGGVIHDVPTEHAWRAKGRPRKNPKNCGKGGIPSLVKLSLEYRMEVA